MVGTDNIPEGTVTLRDNIINSLEELTTEEIFNKGIIVGFAIALILFLFVTLFIVLFNLLSKEEKENKECIKNNNTEITKEKDDDSICNTIDNNEAEESTNKTNKKEIQFGTFIKLFIILTGITIAISITLKDHLSVDLLDKPTKATADDIYIESETIPEILEPDTYYLKIQANSKIQGLILEVDLCSNSGKVLLTQTLIVGNLTPGNEYKFELSINGIDPSDIDKIAKYQYRVIDGIIVE